MMDCWKRYEESWGANGCHANIDWFQSARLQEGKTRRLRGSLNEEETLWRIDPPTPTCRPPTCRPPQWKVARGLVKDALTPVAIIHMLHTTVGFGY